MILRSRFLPIALLFAGIATPSFASQFSFTGNFYNDNDVQLFTFSLLATNTVTLQTWSYSGGVNANGQTIAAGGFEPAFQIYDGATGAAAGTFYAFSSFSCPPNNPDPGRLNACGDVFGQQTLGAGDYIVALTQSPNLAVGDNSFGAGFQYDSEPNFNNGFVGTFNFQGDGHWAVDILSVDAAAEVPEPSYGALVPAALLLAGIGARKIRTRRKLHQR